MTPRRPPAPLLDAVLVGASLVDVWVKVRIDEPLRLGCALVAAFSLLLRRRRPLLTFLLALPAVLVSDAVFAALAALYTLASFTRHRTLLAVCVTIFTICDMTSWPSLRLNLAATSTLVTLGYTAATAAAPVFLGQLVQTHGAICRSGFAEISEAHDHKRLLTAQAVLARERAQLAREMHDVVSHQVSLIAVRAGALQVGARDAEVKEAAATIRRLTCRPWTNCGAWSASCGPPGAAPRS